MRCLSVYFFQKENISDVSYRISISKKRAFTAFNYKTISKSSLRRKSFMRCPLVEDLSDACIDVGISRGFPQKSTLLILLFFRKGYLPT